MVKTEDKKTHRELLDSCKKEPRFSKNAEKRIEKPAVK